MVNPEQKDLLEADLAPDPDDLEELLESGSEVAIRSFLHTLHAADLAMVFDRVEYDLWPRVVTRLTTAEISDLMEELPDHLRDDLAELLPKAQLVDAVEKMDSDDAADVIANLPASMAQAVLEELPREDRQEVETLLAYDEDTAGGIMQMELVAVPEDATVDQAVEAIRANADEVGDVHFVYVVDAQWRLKGLLSLDKLILAQPSTPIQDLVIEKFYTVGPEVDQEEVARMFQRYDLVSLAVVNAENILLGRITHDDVIDVLEEEIEEDILRMEGLEEAELVYTNRVFKITSVRLPWLLATIGGTLVSGLIVFQFGSTFSGALALLLMTFVPVIGAMGGNIGSQSSTIVVRGFATGRIDTNNLVRYLLRELVIGAMMGACCGLVVGLVALLWHDNGILGLAVGLSLFLAIFFSAVMGVVVPYFFRLIRVDPAIAAGPLVTTANDIIGLSIYYLVAILILS